MSKRFRPWKIDEPQFLPAAVRNFVANDHLARFNVSLVTEELDLTEITASYLGEKGHHAGVRVALVGHADAPSVTLETGIAR